MCVDNDQKQLNKEFIKTKLQDILNVNDYEFDYLFNNWIKKIVLTFCNKDTQINLQSQINNIINEKNIDVSLLLSDYEFNDNELLQFNYQEEKKKI